MPAEEVSPIQGFKNSPNIVDFRPISAEKRKEEEKASSPLDVPESVTDSPPEGSLQSRQNSEGIMEEVASMERERIIKDRKPKLSQGSQQQEPAKPASAGKDSTQKPQQPQVTKPVS